MMKKYLLSTALVLSAFGLFAQDHGVCGADHVLQEQLQNPEAREKYDAFQEAILRYSQNPQVAVTREDGKRIIPVVFHILHDGGNENIGLNKVQQQLDVLNQDFQRLNPDTVNTPERFYGDTEYTHFTINSDSIMTFVDDSAYIRLYNLAGTSFAFHFNDGSGDFSDSLVANFDNVIEVNIPSSGDTADIASALTDAVNAQLGLEATYSRDTTFLQAPSFTVDGSTQASISYTSEPTFTTSWSGSETDTTYESQIMIVLFENASDPFEPTDTLEVYPADITYNVYDGAGLVTGTETFIEEGNLSLVITTVTIIHGDHLVAVNTSGLGYVDDVLVAGLWNVTSDIPQQGKYIPADCNIEFRLATKDPLGNCTDGVVRIFTSKTNDANNGTGFKGESYWNAFSYLNIWSISNIDMDVEGGGTTLGYAQFPASGLLSTDGIAVRADNIDENDQGGRTATHEVGHWLGLRHIWGDATCGSDDVLDTPIHNGPNFGICGNHPTLDPNNFGTSTYYAAPYNTPGCDPDNPDGEMFINYMDYSSDMCMNTYTLGQKARMDFTLHGDGNEDGIRSYMVSDENLEGTGTADPYIQSDCAPISLFYFQQSTGFALQQMICVGEDVRFEESAYNGAVDTYAWIFEGGDPATSSSSNPVVDYNNSGIYDVTLGVSNTVGSDSRTVENMVIVSSTTAQYQSSWGYVDSFWDEQAFNDDYVVFNQDGSDNKWEWYFGEDGGSTGWESIRMNNVDNGFSEVDELISPSYDLTTVNSPTLQFRYSGAAEDNTPADELRIMASDDCGESWSTRETFSGFELTNAGLVADSYRPSASSPWTDVSVSLGSFADESNVRIKFRWLSGNRSNHFYIDDITLAGSPLGMEDLERQIDLSIAPNPTTNSTAVTMSLPDAAKINLEIVDVLGRDARNILTRDMTNGTHKFDIDLSDYAAGVYYLRISVDNDMVIKKIVKN
ncbi:MAG: hypothetical protein ACI9UR_000694 [Bacteroidia bacterium]|jgi:hypothetical protein